MLLESMQLFPEFNYFTAAFPMSRLPADHERFKEAVEYMWKSADLCAGETVDRKNPDFGRFMALETTTGPKRVCWNTQIAPRNFEGFSRNMGDILVKKGEVEAAKKICQNAKLAKDYQSWKYRSLLEERIAKAEERARLFKEADSKNHPDMMLNSAYACTVCHEK